MSNKGSYNRWLRGQSLSLSLAFEKSMEKLLALQLVQQYLLGCRTIPARLLTSKDISMVEDLTTRLRHLDTMMEQDRGP